MPWTVVASPTERVSAGGWSQALPSRVRSGQASTDGSRAVTMFVGGVALLGVSTGRGEARTGSSSPSGPAFLSRVAASVGYARTVRCSGAAANPGECWQQVDHLPSGHATRPLWFVFLTGDRDLPRLSVRSTAECAGSDALPHPEDDEAAAMPFTVPLSASARGSVGSASADPTNTATLYTLAAGRTLDGPPAGVTTQAARSPVRWCPF